ncbi:MAG TPA: hypothetical protein VGE93_14605, partial [Bryobacteraceae bacterium]
MTDCFFKTGLNRRRFLACIAGVPALARISNPFTLAGQSQHAPSYLALSQVIAPGKDEFPGEKEAMRIVDALQEAVRMLTLPAAPSLTGPSPCPKSYRRVTDDLEEAVFDEHTSQLQEGWKAWIQSLGRVRRVDFYPLPENIVRYEVASERQGKL